jgi:hypothetical protein
MNAATERVFLSRNFKPLLACILGTHGTAGVRLKY